MLGLLRSLSLMLGLIGEQRFAWCCSGLTTVSPVHDGYVLHRRTFIMDGRFA